MQFVRPIALCRKSGWEEPPPVKRKASLKPPSKTPAATTTAWRLRETRSPRFHIAGARIISRPQLPSAGGTMPDDTCHSQSPGVTACAGSASGSAPSSGIASSTRGSRFQVARMAMKASRSAAGTRTRSMPLSSRPPVIEAPAAARSAFPWATVAAGARMRTASRKEITRLASTLT